MIGYIKGIVLDYTDETALIDVSNVGYEIHMPNRMDIRTPIGKPLTLYIHTHAREDALHLFGFPTPMEKQLFLKLIKVSGVGAKTALGILSTFDPGKIVQLISLKDISSLCSVKGIGKKAAEKIIVELSDRMDSFAFEGQAHTLAVSDQDELVSALLNLGYKKATIEHTLSQTTFDSDAPFDTKLRESLKHLSGAR